MTRPHAVVGWWAAANVLLALVLLAFSPARLSLVVYVASAALVAGFGVALLVAERVGREGTLRRRPRRAAAAALAALGLAVVLSGQAYGWWVSLFGLYPLILAALLVRGERLPGGARTAPAALDGAEPARPPRPVHQGSTVGAVVEVPPEHPGHGPPRRPPQPSPSPYRLRDALPLLPGMRAMLRLPGRTLLRWLKNFRR